MKHLSLIIVLLLCLFKCPQTLAAGPFERADIGAPITAQERAQATREFTAILKDTGYFKFIESRVHGIPESNSQKAFWWGSMWTGVQVRKINGVVHFTHQNNGSDNIGIHTAPYLEGACYAYRMTRDPRYAHFARKLIRGFSSWILSGARSPGDNPMILSRSFYPASFSSNDEGRNLVVDYNASRPGIKGESSDYVHIPNNPYFGDLWVKNNRSIDDIGQMIRGMAQIQVCRDIFDEATRQDLDQMNYLYSAWAQTVENANFVIPTYDKNAQVIIPKGQIGDFNVLSFLGFDPNCTGKLAIRFLYTTSPSGLDCGNGISLLEKLIGGNINNDPAEIIRSHHISSIAMAEIRNQKDLAMTLRQGLVTRLEKDGDVVKNPSQYPKLDIQDIMAEYVHAANVGVPMTSEEIRFVYSRLHLAYDGMRAPDYFQNLHLFEAVVPDGVYNYDSPNRGMYFYTIATMIGTCSSAFAQTGVRPLFDCEQVRRTLLE